MERIFESRERRFAFALQNPNGAAGVINARPAGQQWTSGVPNSGSFFALRCDPIEFDRGLKSYENNASFGTKEKTFANVVINASGSMGKGSIKEPFSTNYHDIFIYSHMQAVVEGAATPFTKTLTVTTTNPDFATGKGAYITLLDLYPISGTGWKMVNGVCNSMKLSWKRNEMLQGEYGFMFKGAGTTNETFTVGTAPSNTKIIEPAGAGAAFGMKHFDDIDSATLTLGGAALAITLGGFDIDSTCDVTPIGPDGAGSFSNWAVSNYAGKLTLTLMKDSVAESLISRSLVGGQIRFQTYVGSLEATGQGHLGIDCWAKIKEIKVESEGATYITITADILAPDPNTRSLTIATANSVDRNY